MMLRKSIALAFTLAVLTAACFGPVRVRVDARFWGLVFDVGHIPMWAWLAAVLLYALPERVQPAARRHALAFALAFAPVTARIVSRRTRSLAPCNNSSSTGAVVALPTSRFASAAA